MPVRPYAEAEREYRANGWWEGVTIADLFARNAAATPERTALADAPNRAEFTVGEPTRWTYSELQSAADRLATSFLREGIGKGDVVMVQLPNIAELVITYLAAARIGAIVSPLAVQYRAHELRQTAAIVKPKAFMTAQTIAGFDHFALANEVRGSMPDVRAFYGLTDREFPGVLPLGEIIRSGEVDEAAVDAASASTASSDILTICWTSGTEAEPKGVPRTHDLWTAIAYATTDAAQLRDGDVLLTPFPIVNMSGIGGMLVPWLQTGGTLVLHQPMALPVFMQQIVMEKVNYTVAPPVLLNLLLAKPEMLANVDLSSLRTIGSGSAPLSPSMVKGWKEQHGIDVTNFFGSNEGISICGDPVDVPDPETRARVFPGFGREGLSWNNRCSRGTKTKLVDPLTGDLITEPGVPGELCISGPTVFFGYWDRDDLTEKAFDAEGYFRTGDLFQIEDDRHYRFVGRARDLIIRGGMKIAPEEIETLLAGHPKLADVAVVGIEDAKMEGEQIVTAVVVCKEGETVELPEIRAFLKEKGVAGFKEPRRLVVVPALPRNPLGKVLKREIRASVSG